MTEPWTLLLLRHATAGPAPAGSTDRDRPLSRTGRAEAAGVRAFLRAEGRRVDSVLCSPALRTRQTLEQLDLGGETAVELVAGLYDAGTQDLLRLLGPVGAGQPAGSPTVLVVGHAPAVPGAVHALADPSASSARAVAALHAGFPPATLARLSCPGGPLTVASAALVEVRVATGTGGTCSR